MPEPIMTCILTPEEVLPTPYQAVSLHDAVAHEPQGVYTVARTFFKDRALLFDAHLDRLEESAHLVSIPLTLDRSRLRATLRDLLHQANYPDAKFRITIPRVQPDHIYLALEPYVPVPDAIMQGGAHVITVPLVRENPDAKTTTWMMMRREAQENLPPGVYEGVMVRADGIVLEGLSSNIFGVLNGVLRTAGEQVLAGITRRAVYEFAPSVLPVDPTPLHMRDLAQLSEAMLTSSGRGIVPITQIDGVPVGTGQTGPIVRELQTLYTQWTATHSEPI